ncbi:MAG: hypothetical protein IPI51_17145 [Betaproteobacteria bacterium]|nr:hypothetical protein [Betaproteobacteria bacterium]
MLEMPSTPERQAEGASSGCALKAAMERADATSAGSGAAAAAWLVLLRQGGLTTAQRQRLQDLVAALRQAPPGTLARAGASARSSGA